MKTEFTPIAMRFNKENWESIKDRIEAAGIGHSVWAIDTYYYLCNNWDDDNSLFIGNHSAKHSNFKLVSKVYETWDEAIFLKACGIEVDTYTVSKDFILEAHESACSTWKTKIENQFPELFSKVKLELNKWYRFKSGTLGYFQGFGKASYGFHFDVWDYFEDHRWFCNKEEMHKIDRLATKEEVETALIAEAKKRGLDKQGIRIECLETLKVELSHNNNFACFNYNNNGIYYNGIKVYKNGKWAEIVSEPIELSLEQRLERIEKHLNIN
jgi:hypothetical protein